MSDHDNRDKRTSGKFARVRELLHSRRVGENIALGLAVVAGLVEVLRSVFAGAGFLASATGGLVIVMAFLGVLFFMYVQYENSVVLIAKFARLSRKFSFQAEALAEAKRKRDELERQIAQLREAERMVSTYFADLARAEAAFETVMLGTISPDRIVYGK